jgi:pimeloyl-ACP methyl ester carboxylesterase
LLCGCGSARDEVVTLAASRHLTPADMSAGPFTLFTLAPRRWAADQPLTVYVEGDGFAWINRYRQSDDPTPRDPVGLRLALADPAANLVYVARPCQYGTEATRRTCDPAYWSLARFADEVVVALNTVIDRYRAQSGATRVHLYGFSGGGSLALLAAARRSDVAQVTTVAAILDTEAWTRQIGVTPLYQSLNPADAAPRLGGIPQRHLVGADDKTVPPAVASSYQARFDAAHRPLVQVVPGQGHECCWADAWPRLLRQGDAAR